MLPQIHSHSSESRLEWPNCLKLIAIALQLSTIVGSVLVSNVRAAETAISEDEVSFSKEIRPILVEHCTACHGGVKQAGDVSFVHKDQVLPPEGWVVEPGDAESSILIERVQESDPDLRMPPPDHGRALTEKEIALLTKWIDQGAKWGEHWAFEPPVEPDLPDIKNESWPRVELDYFVLSKLEKLDITPSEDADIDRWLRRVALDLTGLPPTREERMQFRQEHSNDPAAAREAAVDRYLESTAFGERWASVWLDQIRYADSKGLGADGRRNAWKYRDWVIHSLNRDVPFDEFTRSQIAGDLKPEGTIEDRIATAAHRLTQTNEEGGTDDEEFRIAAVLDRVSTVWQTWQGVTFGCVQCHSHPYDPFRHEEFYQFAAFFNNTRDCDLDEEWPTLQAPVDPTDYAKATELDRQIETVRTEIWQTEFERLNDPSLWQPLKNLTASSTKETQVVVEPKDDHDEFHTVDTVSRDTDITLEAPVPDSIDLLTAIRFTAMPLRPESAVREAEQGFVIGHIVAQLLIPAEEGSAASTTQDLSIRRIIIDEPDPFLDPNDSLNPKSSRGFSAYTRMHYPRQCALLLNDAVTVPKGSKIRLVLKHRTFLLASFPMVTRRGHIALSDAPEFTRLLTDDQLNSQREELDALLRERRDIKSSPLPVLEERPAEFARPQHVFERGLFLTKREQVEANTPSTLPPLPVDQPKNRLALAEWLVADSNPLTARVTVNRVWSRLFGTGIVETEEDFGSAGEPPSHPGMLDHLAIRFREDFQWSLKRLIREMVLSRTYGQSSAIRPELLGTDAQNRLLARGPRYRLPAEVVRDQALSVSGLLSKELYGPPVHPPIPDGVWKPFQGGDKWDVPNKDDASRYRRSIYTYTKRSIPYPMFAAFDAPSREFCTPRRLRSNTPLQALMMLNDQTLIECTEAFAERMQLAAKEPAEQIALGLELATCRDASDDEVQELLALYERTLAQSNDSQRAMQSVATVLLNLDEVVMK